MNIKQAGYNQALIDLGLMKDAGFLDSAARTFGRLFSRPTAAPVAQMNTAARAASRATLAPPTPTQQRFVEGLQNRVPAPMAPFKTMAEQAPASAIPAAARSKNVPGFDPASSRLQVAPKTPVNIAQQNQFAGAFPDQAGAALEADKLLQARQQVPTLNSLFKSRPRPQMQEALGGGLFGF